MKIDSVIIPAAGLGTRLLSATKEQPKEMLPIFSRTKNNNLMLKPMIQVIFEQLFDCGFREFVFIVGRNKRSLEDHFTPHYDFLENFSSSKSLFVDELSEFYEKLESSKIYWINQPSPKGFGHAVALAKPLFNQKSFFVHAGDTVIFSKNNEHISDMTKKHIQYGPKSTFYVKKVSDPRSFGVITGNLNKKIISVTNIEEKPKKPKSDLAVMPLYIFEPEIFDCLDKTAPGLGGELQLTDGIKKLVRQSPVHAIKLKKTHTWIDVGSPLTYWHAMSDSYKLFRNK